MSEPTLSRSALPGGTARPPHLGDALEDLRTAQRAFVAFEELLQPTSNTSATTAPPTSRENLCALLSVLNARLAVDLAAAFAASEGAPIAPENRQ